MTPTAHEEPGSGGGGFRPLVVIPTYNERENLGPIIGAVHAVVPAAHVLVVDDASPDGTGQLAEEMAEADERVHVIHRPGKLGLGTAYVTAFRWALKRDYDPIFEMDADFSHDPARLPAFLEAAAAGYDLVLGSRYVEGGGTQNWGLLRRLISRGGSLYARTILGVPVRDLTGGFKCFRRHVLEAIDLSAIRSEGYAFQIEMTCRVLAKGFRVKEIPILFVDRRAGKSKMSRRIFLEAVFRVWQLRFLPGVRPTRRR